jgi:hypothetical protein
MAQAPNTYAQTLNGLFKEVYADKLENLIPDGVKLLNKIKFSQKDRLGNAYHQPVILGQEHGVTFASSSDDAFNLEAPVAGQIQDAQVKGNALVMRSVMGYNAASRAAAGGKAAFESATKYLVENMLRSVTKKLEIEMLYGQVGYGTVASVTGAAVTITTSEWAPGIWSGAEKMPIEIRDITGATSRGLFEVASVNMDTRVITLTSNAATPGVIATDVIYHKGAYGNEFAGIHKIISQTTGQNFGIDVQQYNLFRGNVYDAGAAALSFTKLNKAVSRGIEKGQDGKLLCLINPRGWADLLTEQAALRQYDQSYSESKMENGSSKLVFHSQNGLIEIEPSIYVKEGYAYLLSEDEWMRVGSSDVTFKRPGQSTEFFRDLENSAGYELRLFCDQALFTSAPGRNTLISGVVNAT